MRISAWSSAVCSSDLVSVAACLCGAAASFSGGRRVEHRRKPLRSSGAKARVPFLLPTFSLGKQRKVGRPTGRNKSVDEPTKRSERVRKSSASETAGGIFAAQIGRAHV